MFRCVQEIEPIKRLRRISLYQSQVDYCFVPGRTEGATFLDDTVRMSQPDLTKPPIHPRDANKCPCLQPRQDIYFRKKLHW